MDIVSQKDVDAIAFSQYSSHARAHLQKQAKNISTQTHLSAERFQPIGKCCMTLVQIRQFQVVEIA